MSNRFIFSDMYKMDEEEFFETISLIITKVGLPLLMNKTEECISLQSQRVNSSEFIQFYILQKFFNCLVTEPQEESAYVSAQDVCPICSFCKANRITDCCDLRLKSANNKGCPYLKFLKSYGLESVKLK